MPQAQSTTATSAEVNNNSKGSDIPPHLQNEIYYYFTYLYKTKFDIVVKSCPPNYFGAPASDLRRRVSRFIEKLRRSWDFHSTVKNIHSITAADAPYVSQFHQKLRASQPSQSFTMSDYDLFASNPSSPESRDPIISPRDSLVRV